MFHVVNAVLVLICLFCVWYLTSAEYARPREIGQMERILAGETTFDPANGAETAYAAAPTGRPTVYVFQRKEPFDPLYTPTPTPTPPPTPRPTPPPPPNLQEATQDWVIQSFIDGQTVEFTSGNETFILTVGGPPRDAEDKRRQTVPVRLISVNDLELKVVLGYEDQRVTKEF